MFSHIWGRASQMQANWSANIVLFFLSVTGTVWLGLPFQDHISLHNCYFLDGGKAAMRMRNSAAPVFLTPLDNWQCCAVSTVFKPDACSLLCAPAVNIESWTELPTRGVFLETKWQMQTIIFLSLQNGGGLCKDYNCQELQILRHVIE